MFAVILALAAAHSLATQTFRVPAHDFRMVPARIANWPATLICDAEVSNGPPVTVELLPEPALTAFVRGQSPASVFQLNHRRKLDFRQLVPEKGEYEIVFVNDGDQPSDIAFEATVEFPREPDVARYLSPQRRLAVISISLLVFILTLSWSGFKLMSAMRSPDSANPAEHLN